MNVIIIQQKAEIIVSKLYNVLSSGSRKTNAMSQSVQGLRQRHRVCEIPVHFVRHTQTQAVYVWSERWARISAGLRWLLDSRRWRWRPNYHSLMSPMIQQSGGAQLLNIVNHQLVQYFGLYRTRSAHSRTILFFMCVCVCVFLNIDPIPVSITT